MFLAKSLPSVRIKNDTNAATTGTTIASRFDQVQGAAGLGLSPFAKRTSRLQKLHIEHDVGCQPMCLQPLDLLVYFLRSTGSEAQDWGFDGGKV